MPSYTNAPPLRDKPKLLGCRPAGHGAINGVKRSFARITESGLATQADLLAHPELCITPKLTWETKKYSVRSRGFLASKKSNTFLFDYTMRRGIFAYLKKNFVWAFFPYAVYLAK